MLPLTCRKAYLFSTILISLGLFHPAMAQPFSVITTSSGLPALGNTKIALGDLDNDGDMDVLIQGKNSAANKISAIYENLGNGSFLDLGAPLPPLDNGSVAFADVNNDNYLDFIITGLNTSDTKNITALYLNNKNKTFSLSPQKWDSVAYSSVKWEDLDNDGDQDLFLAGKNNANNKVALVYKNTKGNFTLLTATGITGFSDGAAVIADFNNDQVPDIFITGSDNNNFKTASLYYQDNKGKFILQNFAFPGLSGGDAAAVDYNTDGMMDIIYTGQSQSGSLITGIYRNNNGSSFVSTFNTIRGITNGNFSWIDYDNDGDLDVAVTGDDNNPVDAKSAWIYQNTGGVFTTVTGLKSVSYSTMLWYDTDNDTKPDVLLSGYTLSGPFSGLYKNNSLSSNTPPSIPSGLQHTISDDSVKLSWNPSGDNTTPAVAISYTLWLSTAKDSFTVASPMADLVTGNNYRMAPGTWQTTTTGWLKSLQERKYYWKVQAIDNTYSGSGFSIIDSFTVCKILEPIVKDTVICLNNVVTLTSGLANETITWKTRKKGNTTVTGLFYSQQVTEDDTIIATRITPLECVRYDTINVKMQPLPLVSLPLTLNYCFNTAYSLAQGIVSDTLRWYNRTGLLFTSNTFSGIAIKKDTLWTKTTSLYGCISRDTVIIDTLSLPRFTLGADKAVCKGQEVLTLSVNRSDTISWFNPKTILGLNTPSITLDRPNIKDTIWAKAKSLQGCAWYDTINVNIHPLPMAHAGKDSVICYNTPLQLGTDSTAAKGTFPYFYTWNPGTDFINGSQASDKNPTVRPSIGQTYKVKVTDAFGCLDSSTVQIKINPKSVIDPGLDRSICLGDSTVLGGNPTARNSLFPYRYLWLPGSATGSAFTVKPTVSGTYTLIVSTGNCTPDTAGVKINVNPLPFPSTDPVSDTTIGFGDNIFIRAFGGVSYKWSPEDGLNSSTSQSLVASPLQTTLYTIIVTDENGCEAKDSITVYVKNRLFIPNTFSPNEDLHNDNLKVYGTGIQSLNFIVYDRSGEKLFETNDKEIGWDGTFHGYKQPAGIYQWVLKGKFYDGKALEFNGATKGTAYLLR